MRTALFCFLALTSLAHAQDKTVASLTTPWTAKVSKTLPHPEYPRPQMVRKHWTNLNGQWDLAVLPAGVDKPQTGDYKRKILVPFPIESRLSGIAENVPQGGSIWYRRSFKRPSGERVLLHFGAVDWQARVWVDGVEVGKHTGGYDPFTFDITKALRKGSDHQLVVCAEDPSDSGYQPRGKQVRKPGGIFYTSSSGIWQTVWMEGVPKNAIRDLRISTRNNGDVSIQIDTYGQKGPASLSYTLRQSNRTGRSAAAPHSSPVRDPSGPMFDVIPVRDSGSPVRFRVPNRELWSPESPTLYSLTVSVGNDQVQGYFAFREVKIGKDKQGRQRILLNGKPTFMVGPLDQGFWPDGIYTAPTQEAMEYDLKVTKQLGFNMIRKHVKVEPETWYAACDQMGILVFQDMPSGDKFIGPSDPDILRSPESAKDFQDELKAMVDTHRNHPSIVAWVLYNEGWGEWDTPHMAGWLKKYDPTRVLDSVTGWADRGVGDLMDIHSYPGPSAPPLEKNRAIMLGEFGGLGLIVPGHTWLKTGWGYQSYKTKGELNHALESLFERLHFLVGGGLSAAVYTQTTDVETESNGLMTYDRRILKVDPVRIGKAIRALQLPAPTLQELVPTSEKAPIQWSYTTAKPAGEWQSPVYDESSWNTAPGGFGTAGTPNVTPRTVWNTHDIWIRRSFITTQSVPTGSLYLNLYHDDAAEVFLDGKMILSRDGWTSSYSTFRVKQGLSKGPHTLAIHCHQDAGGQYIDAGFDVVVRGR